MGPTYIVYMQAVIIEVFDKEISSFEASKLTFIALWKIAVGCILLGCKGLLIYRRLPVLILFL
jgi:hypothetical protein